MSKTIKNYGKAICRNVTPTGVLDPWEWDWRQQFIGCSGELRLKESEKKNPGGLFIYCDGTCWDEKILDERDWHVRTGYGTLTEEGNTITFKTTHSTYTFELLEPSEKKDNIFDVTYYWSEDGIAERCKLKYGTADNDVHCYHCDNVIIQGSDIARLFPSAGEPYILHEHCANKACNFTPKKLPKTTKQLKDFLNIEENKKLFEEYPFLMPRDDETGEPIKDYDYSWTLLDEMPEGWRKAFADELLKELKEILIEEDFLEQYRIMQIKEKFGCLRWQAYKRPMTDRYFSWATKYMQKSIETCIVCGKPATHMTTDYIEPLCDSCK